ncbi:unnamed protein product [Sphagnum jensenii]|uniref:Photosystem II subunit H n=1 Tax=Sphagnum jensenii TaxID=128206 RepID=A0ABP0WLM2_9BRYO
MCATAMITPKSTRADHKEKCYVPQAAASFVPLRSTGRRKGRVQDLVGGPSGVPSLNPIAGRVQDLVDARGGGGLR